MPFKQLVLASGAQKMNVIWYSTRFMNHNVFIIYKFRKLLLFMSLKYNIWIHFWIQSREVALMPPNRYFVVSMANPSPFHVTCALTQKKHYLFICLFSNIEAAASKTATRI